MALTDSSNKLHAFATQITHILPNIYYDVSLSIDSYQQYQLSLACAIGIPYVEGVGCEIWDLLMKHEDLSKTNKKNNVKPDYEKWIANLGLPNHLYVFNECGRRANVKMYLCRKGFKSKIVPPFTTIEFRNKMRWCETSEAETYRMEISSVTTRGSGTTLLIPSVADNSCTGRKSSVPAMGSLTVAGKRGSARKPDKEETVTGVRSYVFKKPKVSNVKEGNNNNVNNNDVGTSSGTSSSSSPLSNNNNASTPLSSNNFSLPTSTNNSTQLTKTTQTLLTKDVIPSLLSSTSKTISEDKVTHWNKKTVAIKSGQLMDYLLLLAQDSLGV